MTERQHAKAKLNGLRRSPKVLSRFLESGLKDLWDYVKEVEMERDNLAQRAAGLEREAQHLRKRIEELEQAEVSQEAYRALQRQVQDLEAEIQAANVYF